jgi:hypothetical protein
MIIFIMDLCKSPIPLIVPSNTPTNTSDMHINSPFSSRKEQHESKSTPVSPIMKKRDKYPHLSSFII